MEQPSTGRTSKTRSYLLYALGEVALVMIGILLALQVSNWNQQRLEQNLAADYQLRLLDDLLQEKATINGIEDYKSGVKEYALRAIRTYESDKELSVTESNQFLIDIYQASQILDVTGTNSTYQELISSGQISLIQKESIRSNIIRFYDVSWYNTIPFILENPFRTSLRKEMPSFLQEEIRRNCDDTFTKLRDRLFVQLAETCGVQFEEEIAITEAAALLQNENLKKDLQYLIGNLTAELNILVLIETDIDLLIEQLQADL